MQEYSYIIKWHLIFLQKKNGCMVTWIDGTKFLS